MAPWWFLFCFSLSLSISSSLSVPLSQRYFPFMSHASAYLCPENLTSDLRLKTDVDIRKCRAGEVLINATRNYCRYVVHNSRCRSCLQPRVFPLLTPLSTESPSSLLRP